MTERINPFQINRNEISGLTLYLQSRVAFYPPINTLEDDFNTGKNGGSAYLRWEIPENEMGLRMYVPRGAMSSRRMNETAYMYAEKNSEVRKCRYEMQVGTVRSSYTDHRTQMSPKPPYYEKVKNVESFVKRSDIAKCSSLNKLVLRLEMAESVQLPNDDLKAMCMISKNTTSESRNVFSSETNKPCGSRGNLYHPTLHRIQGSESIVFRCGISIWDPHHLTIRPRQYFSVGPPARHGLDAHSRSSAPTITFPPRRRWRPDNPLRRRVQHRSGVRSRSGTTACP